MAKIVVNQLNKTFFPNTSREYHALKDIDLTIQDGDFITIVGGNGAGKSTLLNALAGVFTLDSGQIKIDNEIITDLKEHQRARFISRVFQDPLQGTAPRMTVMENLALASRRGKKRGLGYYIRKQEPVLFQEALATLDLGLETRLETEIGLLSGGQRQAIALLMATMVVPKLLLLDEHTAALDPKTQRQMMRLTQQAVVTNKLTTLMITHHLQDAIDYGNRMLVMHHGRIVADFTNEEKQNFSASQLYDFLSHLDD